MELIHIYNRIGDSPDIGPHVQTRIRIPRLNHDFMTTSLLPDVDINDPANKKMLEEKCLRDVIRVIEVLLVQKYGAKPKTKKRWWPF